jgi:hypothetical protein
MRNAAALIHRHLLGANVEPAIDGGGIAADDLAAMPQREIDAERALARRGRAQDGQDRTVQTLHPEEDEHHDGGKEYQQAELLRSGRQRHLVTGNPQGPRCRGTSP